MGKRMNIVVGVALASVIAVGSIAGTAFAADPETETATPSTSTNTPNTTTSRLTNSPAPACGRYGNPGLYGQQLKTISDLLGLTPQEIMKQRMAGKSLMEIAAAQNITQDSLVSALLELNRTSLQQKVDAGVITATQLEERLTALKPVIVLEVNAPDIAPFGYILSREPKCRGAGWFKYDAAVITSLLGLTGAEIRTEIAAGKSLVEIAAAQNVTEGQLVNAILEPRKTDITAKVTAGIITQAQADQAIQLLEQRIQEAINLTAGASSGNIPRGKNPFRMERGDQPGMKEGMMGQGRGQCPDKNGPDSPTTPSTAVTSGARAIF
jgi:hypothetical protein